MYLKAFVLSRRKRLEFVAGAALQVLPVEAPGPTLPALLADWERHLRGRGPNPIPAEEGLAAVAVCEACALSARVNREVSL